jgi:fatty acid desaturase
MFPPNESSSGLGLLAVVSFGVVITVIAECAFIAYASWLLLPLIMLTVIGVAVAVVATVVHALDDTPELRETRAAATPTATRAATTPRPLATA